MEGVMACEVCNGETVMDPHTGAQDAYCSRACMDAAADETRAYRVTAGVKARHAAPSAPYLTATWVHEAATLSQARRRALTAIAAAGLVFSTLQIECEE
jgi:hypothetical protein